MTLDTGALAGQGKVHVPLATSDPAAPTLMVTLLVEVEPALLADPGYARYNVVQKERDGTIAQTVWSADGAPFRVLSVESPNDALRVLPRGDARRAPRRRRQPVARRVVLAADAAVGALAATSWS